ncbi:MAG: Ribosome-binding ATPase YchF [Methanonatronarchaeales archaeon]|nr:Ribosome-binding ATPase YchF [Methanonatronarchaeales archaeon]
MPSLLGVVGKPNAGKSTFFKAATLADAEAANYPFTTIEPNRGVAYVRDDCPCSEFGVDCEPRNSLCVDGTRLVTVQMIDVAGLVPGAYEGRGLGNRFLDHLRRADALMNVVDATGGTDEEGNPVEPGSREPALDVEFLEREVDMWMLSILEENWGPLMRRVESGGSGFVDEAAEVFGGLGISRRDVAVSVEGEPEGWSREERRSFVEVLRARSKPIQVVANKVDAADPGPVGDLVERFDAEPVSADAELALRRAAENGLIGYLPGDASFEVTGGLSRKQEEALSRIEESVLERYGSTGVQRSIERTVRDLIGKIVVYPVREESRLSDSEGRVLPDAVLLDRSSTARDLAYALHTDIGEAFHHAVDVRSGRRLSAEEGLENGDVVRIAT